jgi:hypothetical protein
MSKVLSVEEIQRYRTQGWLLCDDLLGVSVEELQGAVDEVATWVTTANG